MSYKYLNGIPGVCHIHAEKNIVTATIKFFTTIIILFLQPITNLKKKLDVSHKIYIARNEGIYHLYLFKGNFRKIRDTYSTSGTLRMHYIGVFGDFLFTLLP